MENQCPTESAALEHHCSEPQSVRITRAAEPDVERGTRICDSQSALDQASCRGQEIVRSLSNQDQGIYRAGLPVQASKNILRRRHTQVAAALSFASQVSGPDPSHFDNLLDVLGFESCGFAEVVERSTWNA